jgi:hypothetical protein
MRIVYVAGPHRGEIKYNVLKAAAVGRLLRQCGKAVIIPHVESLFFPGSLTEEEWIEHGIDLLHCVDTVVLVPEWQDSSGTRNEIEYAKEYKKSVYEFDELCNILKADRSIRFDDYFAEYSQFVARLDSYRKEIDRFIITPFNDVVDPSTTGCILDRHFFCITPEQNVLMVSYHYLENPFVHTLMLGDRKHTVTLEQDERIELGYCPIDTSTAIAKIYYNKKIKNIVCNAQATMVDSKFICNKNNDNKCSCFSGTKNKKKSNKKVTPVTKNNNGSS